ncbi:50S ribosomal protein L3 N(5)-glutamine methyltransferase [Ancylobacter dichloromethanicus]|uniref:50S ribosomal protein L3 glutamine methyltransferase n=1 Tax=Ancylobacter dichloromethanicus TaxID=518825 RepID=A0A9W6MXW1_9HYPH|nr:50S ribosomal protein L3 N(5)-glutamine methyltransferase [Ancylobacter dichloromethanicus]MBS7553882.1 50S ribosomal protein L3 N(5)-glutamine methyltransferase [Ancylobacter dichloromethanicus]GLK70989.1 50S ribosomal protein L3 glutamine methyltransferase [Ancylobacter dichloromethanicus]
MTAADDLRTVRDFVRYAVSRFTAARLAFGHGTGEALDEAAFMVLEALHLPVDDLSPWLDARLTGEERARLADLIERRCTTRQPAAYLLGRTYIGGVPFRSDPRAIVPRSFIGELMAGELFTGGDFSLVPQPETVGRVLDLCTGSGCLAILAAMTFPNARVDGVDLSPDALALAAENVAEHGLGERVRLIEGDLFAPLGGEVYDLIITNPPYVDAEAMAALPAEYRHEPSLAFDGGPDGLDIVRRILAAAPDHLSSGGGMICEIGTGKAILEAEYPNLPFLWLDTEDSEGEVFWLSAVDLAVTTDLRVINRMPR